MVGIPRHEDVNNLLVRKVMVLYTGGTIGMVRNNEGVLAPAKQALELNLRELKTLHDVKFAREVLRYEGMLVLPNIPDVKRIAYAIQEYDPLLDSSNMSMDDWSRIAQDIGEVYSAYDGFVVLHGTDTLSYTASALSFMLQNLGKTVVVTGSQIPCFETRSDGRDNITGALIFAGNYTIPEVTVYFDNKLLRGNRTIKVSAGNLHAFDSPNLAPLAKAGINIDVDYQNILKPVDLARFVVEPNLCRNVAMLRIFPSIMTDTIRHFLQPPIEGVVLQCYGAGNVPSNRKDILDAIAEGTRRGVIILCVTQCSHGGVDAVYETGAALLHAGAIPGSDITPEAALAKLAHILSLPLSLEEKRTMMGKSLYGEMTTELKLLDPTTGKVEAVQSAEMEMLTELIQNMKLSRHELKRMKELLFPCLMCSAAFKGDTAQLEFFLSEGADISAGDYDLRTPLHIAASEGNLEMTKFLLKHGALIHKKDRHNDPPLLSAIYSGNIEVINLLLQVGAHLPLTPVQVGERLTSAAKAGNATLICSYLAAGADINQADLAGVTCAAAAVAAGHDHVLQQIAEKSDKSAIN